MTGIHGAAQRIVEMTPKLTTAIYDGTGVRGPDALTHVGDAERVARAFLAAEEKPAWTVRVRTIDRYGPGASFEMPAGWPIPRIHESFGLAEGVSGEVTSVTHYPFGEFGEGAPFVYVVVRT